LHVFCAGDVPVDGRKVLSLSQLFVKPPEHLHDGQSGTGDRVGKKLRTILQEETNLQEIVQLVGKESLSEDQKLNLETAKIIREDFLQQNAFTSYDYRCPLEKTSGMMEAICCFFDCSLDAINSTSGDSRVTMESINTLCEEVKYRIVSSKEDCGPEEKPEVIKKFFNTLVEDIRATFTQHFG
jgi:V-type H+-transporting ATPase subunit A